MLKLEKVSKYYSQNGMVSTGFSKVDLEFEIGEFVAITGESGSGKSTLLNVISGLDTYEEGEMYIMGESTSGFMATELEEYRKKYIGNIFQTFNLINSYTVYQNVELILLMSGYSKTDIKPKAEEIIAKVGLTEYRNTKASKLSGGQKQRVAIARALAKETPIIVADEPTGNLDSQSAADIIALLNELSRDKLIIIVTHNYDQVEDYVTRKITMHDGKVVEDKRLKGNNAGEGAQPQRAKADKLSLGNEIRLGVRNTFNIPAKFILLLIVFIFLCVGIISPYASVQNMDDANDDGWNEFFKNLNKNRILITKDDRSVFTDDDYEKIAAIENVDKIIKNDLTLDLTASIQDEKQNGEFYISAKFGMLEDYADRLEAGRLPKNANEGIVMMPHDGYADMVKDQFFEKKTEIADENTGTVLVENGLKIVGYGYLESSEEEALIENAWSECYICVNEKTMKKIRFATLEKYCTQEIEFDGHKIDGNSGQGLYKIRPSDKVLEGEIYIPEDISSLSERWAIWQDLYITNKSIYFEDKYKFYVGAVYNEQTLNYYLDRDDYEMIAGSIFVNPNDYKKMFSKKNFQSSVITADEKLTTQTAQAIKDAGYNAFVVHDGKVSYSPGGDAIIRLLSLGLMAVVVIVLFFISYFIIKLILKSRNTYYSTIRMLGATKKNCSGLLRTELFVVFNIAFAISCIITVLARDKYIPCEDTLQNALTYLQNTDFIILYAILCVISLLLAGRYSRQLFKSSAMNVFKEEV